MCEITRQIKKGLETGGKAVSDVITNLFDGNVELVALNVDDHNPAVHVATLRSENLGPQQIDNILTGQRYN